MSLKPTKVREKIYLTTHEEIIGAHKEHYKPMYYLALNILGTKEEAEDIVLTELERLRHTGYNSYGGDRHAELRRWLLICTRNAGVTRLRELEKDRTYRNTRLDEYSEGEPAADDILIRTELLARLNQYLNDLSPKARQVLDLRYKENKTRKEVAEGMHLTIRRIHKIETRALNALRKKLRKHNLWLLLCLELFFCLPHRN